MTNPQPWPMERRDRTKRKIDKEAKRAAVRLGASHVTIIAFFADGEYLHMQDGGTSPIDPKELHLQMAKACEINAQRTDSDDGVWTN